MYRSRYGDATRDILKLERALELKVMTNETAVTGSVRGRAVAWRGVALRANMWHRFGVGGLAAERLYSAALSRQVCQYTHTCTRCLPSPMRYLPSLLPVSLSISPKSRPPRNHAGRAVGIVHGRGSAADRVPGEPDQGAAKDGLNTRGITEERGAAQGRR